MKTVADILHSGGRHWVGDGFPVRSLFNYREHAEQFTPFLMLDHAGPYEFSPSDRPRGVGEHPHRGFETVTIVRQGEVAHRDSTGEGGVIGPGDVQWMTAGAGILHEEYHSREFTREGGTLEMIQLWVNLPSDHKMTPPGYQALEAERIPTVELPDGGGTLRVIAGEYDGQSGPADTFTPMHVWEMELKEGAEHRFELPDGWTGAIVTLDGTVVVNDEETGREGDVAVFERRDRHCSVFGVDDASMLVLSGEPIDEPVVGHGPFVMNSEEEIQQAMRDVRSGQFAQAN